MRFSGAAALAAFGIVGEPGVSGCVELVPMPTGGAASVGVLRAAVGDVPRSCASQPPPGCVGSFTKLPRTELRKPIMQTPPEHAPRPSDQAPEHAAQEAADAAAWLGGCTCPLRAKCGVQ